MNRNKSKPRWLLVLAVSLCTCLVGFSQTTSPPETRSAARQKFYCVDARGLDFSSKLLLESLQALANSNAPVLFLIQRPEDVSWRKAMEQQLGQASETISADQALARFGANAPQVIWNWDYFWSLSIATTLAGVNQALLTDHTLAGHPVAYDFHNNQWTNKIEAYHWALKDLLPSCDRHQLVYLDEEASWLRDYAMQQKLFVLNLDPVNDPLEIKLLEEILARFPAQTRIFGWAKGAYAKKERHQDGVMVENALVARLSRRGMMLVPADFAGNLSFYVHTLSATAKPAQRRLPRALRLQPGKRYILLLRSDGDNLQYNLGTMRTYWKDYEPLRIPIAWTISPQLIEVAPSVLQTYYQEAAEQGGWAEFVAGPSGYGYVNPGSMGSVQLAQFIRQTRQACERADIRSITVIDNGSRPVPAVFKFIDAYATAEFDGLWLVGMPSFVGMSGTTAYANERYRLDDSNPKALLPMIKDITDDQPFAVIYVVCETKMEVVREFVHGLGDTCVIVSPTEMANLIRQWHVARKGAMR